MLGWLARTALGLVGQGGLGWSFDKLDSPEPNYLAELFKAFVSVISIDAHFVPLALTSLYPYRPTVSPLFILMKFMPFFVKIGPAWFRRKVVEAIPLYRFRKAMEISDTLDRTIRQILESKKAALAAGDEAVTSQIGEGKDIISVLSTSSLSKSRLNMSEPGSSEIPDAS